MAGSTLKLSPSDPPPLFPFGMVRYASPCVKKVTRMRLELPPEFFHPPGSLKSLPLTAAVVDSFLVLDLH